MSARSDLRDKIAIEAPDDWEIYPYPTKLKPFTDPAKPVAIVIEQRGITSDRLSSDGEQIPVTLPVALWVVVDGSRGDLGGDLEDRLEGAAETMIRILEPLNEATWDGTADRTMYDEQKPAYQFTLSFRGSITQEETE